MDSDRSKQLRRQGLRQPLDRRVDNWIETGRRVVDGVAGNRPGIRRTSGSRLSGKSLDQVGRWVGDKLDWFLEDEDEWMDPKYTDSQASYSSSKKPLDAVSLRVKKQTSSSSKEVQDNCDADEWPEESSFRVERWQRRGQINENVDSEKFSRRRSIDTKGGDRRPLPRSSRRRL